MRLFLMEGLKEDPRVTINCPRFQRPQQHDTRHEIQDVLWRHFQASKQSSADALLTTVMIKKNGKKSDSVILPGCSVQPWHLQI